MNKCREAFENVFPEKSIFGYIEYDAKFNVYGSKDDLSGEEPIGLFTAIANLNGAWWAWQSRQAELDQQKLLTLDSELHLDAAKEEIERLKGVVDEKDKRIEVLENRIEEGLGFIDKFHCEGWLSDLDNAEKALRGEQ